MGIFRNILRSFLFIAVILLAATAIVIQVPGVQTRMAERAMLAGA